MSKFTKGKWQCDFEESKYIFCCDGDVLGEVYFTTSDEETEANARLIAAAPEMYELLENLVDILLSHLYSEDKAIRIVDLLARIDGEEKVHD